MAKLGIKTDDSLKVANSALGVSDAIVAGAAAGATALQEIPADVVSGAAAGATALQNVTAPLTKSGTTVGVGDAGDMVKGVVTLLGISNAGSTSARCCSYENSSYPCIHVSTGLEVFQDMMGDALAVKRAGNGVVGGVPLYGTYLEEENFVACADGGAPGFAINPAGLSVSTMPEQEEGGGEYHQLALKTATTTTLGGVIVGEGLNVADSGTVSVDYDVVAKKTDIPSITTELTLQEPLYWVE